MRLNRKIRKSWLNFFINEIFVLGAGAAAVEQLYKSPGILNCRKLPYYSRRYAKVGPYYCIIFHNCKYLLVNSRTA